MFAIAHLSDIHIADSLDPVLQRGSLIAAAVGGFCVDCEDVIIAISGDIAYSGKSDQYDLASEFFREITDSLKKDYNLRVHYVICPGNHDCDFDGDQEFRELALAKIFSGQKPSDRAINECTSVQCSYFSFLKDFCGIVPREPDQKLRYTIQVHAPDGVVSFDCINLAWVSRLSEDKITFPPDIIPDRKVSEGLNITICHHPFNWLHASSYREFRKRVRAGADIVLTGHEHEWAVLETTDTDSGACVQIEGAVLQDRKVLDYSAFSVILINVENKSYRAQKFELSGNIYSRTENEEWRSFRPLRIAAPDGHWSLTDAFDAEMSDLGMALRATSGRDITLDDVFIFPELECTSGKVPQNETPDSVEVLLTADRNRHGFVIQGDEKSGRSSILRQLLRASLNNGLVPLMLKGEDLKHSAEHEIDNLIERKFRSQLRGGSIEAYRQLPKEQKAIFIDDIDESSIRSERVVAQILGVLARRCGRLVVTAGEAYETSKNVSEAGAGVLANMPVYEVRQFGYLARTKLIKKWIFLSATESQSEDDIVSRVHNSESFISGVLRRGVVPAYPVYLLALLHAEGARKGEALEEGGVGHYYEYLITQGILDANIDRKKLDEIYDYCTQLAWAITTSGEAHISDETFRKFNEEYSSVWNTVEFSSRRDELIRSRLIAIRGERVEFRYPYLLYYFTARYLSLNLDDALAFGYIRESAAQLYVRARANALVFLTHFTTRVDVIDLILATLHGQFDGTNIVRFNEQGESVESLLRDLPKIAYQGGDPLTHREAEASAKDELHAEDDLPDHPSDSDARSIPCRLASVFRGIEIVGQILKVRYSKFKRAQKEAMVDQVIVAPLQALERFYELLRKHPRALIAQFATALTQEGDDCDEAEKENLARKIAGFIVLAVSFAFVKKIADALSAEVLRENLDSVVDAHGELAYKLVELACYLDGQRGLPREMIKNVIKLGTGSLIVENLVRLMVVYRMHMFRTTASDVNWAREALHISTKVKVQALMNSVT